MTTVRNIVLVLFATLVLLELGLRLTGEFRTYPETIRDEYYTDYGQHINHAFFGWLWSRNDSFMLHREEFVYAYKTNKWGRRARPISEVRSTTDRIAIVFGDSFTEGAGASADSTWVRSWERSIHEVGMHCMAVNAGMSGSDPVLDGIAFESRYRTLGPDLVIQVVNRTDYIDCVFRGGRERLQADSTLRNRPAPWFHPFYRFSHVVRGVLQTTVGMDELLVPRSRRTDVLEESVPHLAHAIRRMDSICRADGADFLVVHLSINDVIDREDPFPSLTRSLIDATPHLRHITIETGAVRARAPADHPIAWPIDGHYNGRGYTLLGDVIFDEIMTQYPDVLDFNAVCK